MLLTEKLRLPEIKMTPHFNKHIILHMYKLQSIKSDSLGLKII